MASKIKDAKTEVTDGDYVRMYFEHQYDRIARQEEYRLTITNYVLSLSALALTFGYQNASNLTVINGTGLPLIIIVVNIFAIATIDRTKESVRIHQSRAYETLERYAPALKEISEKHPSLRRKGILRNRSGLQKGIHLLLILTALIPITVYLYQIYG